MIGHFTILYMKGLKLNDCFNNFDGKYEIVNSNLSFSRRYSELLLERITQLERNNLTPNITEGKLLKLIQRHLILLIILWNNPCAKQYNLQEYQ